MQKQRTGASQLIIPQATQKKSIHWKEVMRGWKPIRWHLLRKEGRRSTVSPFWRSRYAQRNVLRRRLIAPPAVLSLKSARTSWRRKWWVQESIVSDQFSPYNIAQEQTGDYSLSPNDRLSLLSHARPSRIAHSACWRSCQGSLEMGSDPARYTDPSKVQQL